MFLYRITDLFQSEKLPFVIVGGYALALHGLVRATVDVDFVLSLKLADLEKAEKCLGQLGLRSRLPISARDIFTMRKEYMDQRNLIAWSFVDYINHANQVDILINKKISDLKSEKIRVAGRSLPVASLKTLIELKEEAGRPQDLVDIQNIKDKLSGKI